MGGGLSKNRFFDKEAFPFENIAAAPGKASLKVLINVWGIIRSIQIIRRFSPDLIVGFGSFYTFPLLTAACLLKSPFILHEQNAIPGRVNRLFAPFAKATALTFPSASSQIRGRTIETAFPIKKPLEIDSTWDYFKLKKQLTLLVYGGSQGASHLNTLFCSTLATLKCQLPPFQVIHFAGKNDDITAIQAKYDSAKILASVKAFEPHPDVALRMADLAITRAGAGTIAELIAYAVPAIVIPFPHASENHQVKNGEHFVNNVGGGWLFRQETLTSEQLAFAIEKALSEIPFKKSQIILYKKRQASLKTLSQIIMAQIS